MRWVPPAHSPIHWRDVPRALWHRPAESLMRARHAVATRFGADEVLLCDSGTAALTLALRVAGVTHPGPVAIPGYGCFDIATAVDGIDGIVRLYDIDPATLGPDLASLDRVLAAGARRVVAAPLYGVPLDWDAIRGRCDAAGAILIEDAAQGSGAEWRGSPHGALGELSVLSFGRGKGRTAGGGGALLARDRGPGVVESLRALTGPAVASVVGRFANTARLVGQLLLSRPALFGIAARVPGLHVGETRYQPAHRPRGMASSQAAMVPAALDTEEREVAIRRGHAARLTVMVPATVAISRVAPGARAGYLRFPIIPQDPIVMDDRMRRFGVAPGYPRTLADLDGFRHRIAPDRRESLPGAQVLVSRLLTLPTHSLVGEEDLRHLSQWLNALR